jgi:SAM-dependent methyltransferase
MEHSPNATPSPVRWPQRERAFLDFSQGFMNTQTRILRPKVNELYEEKSMTFENKNGREPSDPDEIGAMMDDQPIVQYLRFFRRKSQEMKWVGLDAMYEDQFEKIERWLETPTPEATGLLELDPDLEIPDYFFHGYHHQPGGFSGHALSGLMYDMGLDVSFPGLPSGGMAERVDEKPYERILDLGCGSGRSTEPYKVRFPNAEVWGVEPSAPLLRVAHKRAGAKHLEVNYRQAMAEQTQFPDGHFDLVSATILFHEVTAPAMKQVLREVRRILAPGGQLVIGDELPFELMTDYERWYDRWQTVHNNEPYWEDIKSQRFEQLCREAGFAEVIVEHRGNLRFFGEARLVWPPFKVFAS